MLLRKRLPLLLTARALTPWSVEPRGRARAKRLLVATTLRLPVRMTWQPCSL